MQKKLIALAVAGLMTAPVMAQSNVTIYGVMDVGVQSLGSSDTHKRANRIDQGLSTPNLIGFRGTEDLGNGLSAFFVLEAGTSPDTGGGNWVNRQSHVGLRGGFGSLSVGHHWNPTRQAVVGLDPFGASGVGSFQNIIIQQTHLSNSIVYSTPSMSGFKVDLSYSTNIAGNVTQETNIVKGATDTNRKQWSISPTYRNGPIYAGLTYEQHKQDQPVNDLDRKAWHLFGSYDFGAAKLNALYGQIKQGNALSSSDVKVNQWLVALTAPVSEAGTVGISYARSKHELPTAFGISDPKVSKWAIGYTHALSKRTSMYARYARLSTNSSAQGRYSLNANNTNVVPGATTDGYESGINIGVRHNF